MAKAESVLDSVRWDLRAKAGNAFEPSELLDYLNRVVGILDSSLLSINSDWLKKADAVEALSAGLRQITMPTRCIGVDSIWRSATVSASTDMTYTNSTGIILSAATNYATAGFAADDKIGVGGSASNDSDAIGLLTISAIGDAGAGTNNEITVNETSLVDEGAADANGTIIKVENNEILKASNEDIHRWRKWRGSGTPVNWAWEGTNIIFDYFADQAYGLIIHFSQKTDTLEMSSDMPYNDEFNEQLRQGVVMIGENKYDEVTQLSAALLTMFEQSARTKTMRRGFVPKRYRLNF